MTPDHDVTAPLLAENTDNPVYLATAPPEYA